MFQWLDLLGWYHTPRNSTQSQVDSSYTLTTLYYTFRKYNNNIIYLVITSEKHCKCVKTEIQKYFSTELNKNSNFELT